MKTTFSPITDFEISTLPKDTTFGRRVYEGAGNAYLQISVILMGIDRTSIHRPEVCLPGQGWQILRSETDVLHLSRPKSWDLPVQKLTLDISVTATNGAPIQMGGVYVYWFVADGLVTASHTTRMLWMARDLVLKQTLDRWACIGCFMPCAPGRQPETYDLLKKLIAESVPQFQTTFPPSPVASAPLSISSFVFPVASP
jgi:ferredoxin